MHRTLLSDAAARSMPAYYNMPTRCISPPCRIRRLAGWRRWCCGFRPQRLRWRWAHPHMPPGTRRTALCSRTSPSRAEFLAYQNDPCSLGRNCFASVLQSPAPGLVPSIQPMGSLFEQTLVRAFHLARGVFLLGRHVSAEGMPEGAGSGRGWRGGRRCGAKVETVGMSRVM